MPPPGFTPGAYGRLPTGPVRRSFFSRLLRSLAVGVMILSVLLNLYLGLLVFRLVASNESVLRAGNPLQRIVVVPVEGGIDGDMATYFRETMQRLNQNPPRAVVLRVDSGGGGVSASDQMWDALNTFKNHHPKVPVVASFGSVAASGGYYIAAPCDYIFCERTGITGSIGVIAQVPALESLAAMAGVEMNTVVADGSPKKEVANNLFKNWRNNEGTLNEGGLASQAVLKKLTNSAWNRFVEVVDQGRTQLDRSEVQKLATGEVYTALEAEALGLVDGVGYLNQAIDKAAELAGLDANAKPHVTQIRRDGGLMGMLGARRSASSKLPGFAQVDSPEALRTWIEDFTQARLSYRMQLQ